MILTATADIIQPEKFDPRSGADNAIVVAGISTKYAKHPQSFVKLPFRPSESGHPVTGLRKDCAAIVGWYQAIFIADDVTAFSGDVPIKELRELLDQVFADYVAKVGDQYITVLEMLSDLRQTLIQRELSE